MGPDLADEFDSLFELEAEDFPEWQPEWEMASFVREHPDLKVADWQLSQERLLELAELAVTF